MRKLIHRLMTLAAFSVGFLLGSRAGRQPYEKLEEEVRRLRRKPEVDNLVSSVKEETSERAGELAGKVSSAVSRSKSDPEPASWPASTAV